MANDGPGAWFCARTETGRVVGTSSALQRGDRGCSVDGFVHLDHSESWRALIQAAIDWATDRSASPVWTTVSFEDEEKLSMFESMGFRNTGEGEPVHLDSRQVRTLRCELV